MKQWFMGIGLDPDDYEVMFRGRGGEPLRADWTWVIQDMSQLAREHPVLHWFIVVHLVVDYYYDNSGYPTHSALGHNMYGHLKRWLESFRMQFKQPGMTGTLGYFALTYRKKGTAQEKGFTYNYDTWTSLFRDVPPYSNSLKDEPQ